MIAGKPLRDGDINDLIDHIGASLRESSVRLMVTPNVDQVLLLDQDAHWRRVFMTADLHIADGMPIVALGRLLGATNLHRLTGADLLPEVLRRASVEGWKVAVVGGRLTSSDLLIGAGIDGAHDAGWLLTVEAPQLSSPHDPTSRDVITTLRGFGPDLVFVCLGSPKQELWVDAWRHELPDALYIGAGAAADFLVRKVSRAPRWMRSSGLEWVYRLLQEPRRLGRRYLLRGPRFVLIAVQALTAKYSLVGPLSKVIRKTPRHENAQSVPRVRRVAHVGPAPGSPGGMATVIEELLELNLNGYSSFSAPTWSPYGRAAKLRTAVAGYSRLLTSRWDIAHLHLSEFGSFVREGGVVALSRLLGRKSVVTLHGANLSEQFARFPRFTRWVLDRADHVVCLGSEQERLLKSNGCAAPTSLMMNPLPRAVEASDGTLPDKPYFLFAGEVGTRKGFDILVEAWRMTQRAQGSFEAELRIVGPLADKSPLTDLPGGVHFLGPRTRAQVLHLMRGARATLLPSRAEVLPMVILESLSVGTPAVYTKVGEWKNFASCPDVHLVDPSGSTEVVAARLSKLIGDLPKPTSDDRLRAIDWVSAHAGSERISESLLNVYAEVSADRVSARGPR